MKKFYAIIITLCGLTVSVKAQQGFGTNNPAPSSVIDMTATNKGVLMPRVGLTGTTDIATIASPANALTVFNTSTTTTGTNDVTPGYYYYSTTASKWVRLLDQAWGLTGNAGTSPAINFIGTTDAQDLRFKVNNQNSGYIQISDNVLSATGHNTAFGYKAGDARLSTGEDNTLFGSNSGRLITTGDRNTAFGARTLVSAATTFNNTAVGAYALFNTTGNNNTAFGSNTMFGNIGGTGNTAFGSSSLQNNSSGSDNIAIGRLTGNNITTGSSNIAIGLSSAVPDGTASNQLSIANFIYGTGLNSLTTGKIGIATSAPLAKLHIKEASQTSAQVGEGLLIPRFNNGIRPIGPETGLMIFDIQDRKFYGWDGFTWSQSVFGKNSTDDTTNDAWVNNEGSTRVELGTQSDGTTARTAGTEFVALDNGNVGIGIPVPTNTLDINGMARVRTRTNTPTKITGVDANGVISDVTLGSGLAITSGTLSAVSSTPKFFYAPSIVLPTTPTGLPANINYDAGTSTYSVNLYTIYSNQFSMTGNVLGATRTAIKSPNATTLPIEPVASLEYFITYFDNTVFDPATITLSDAGVLTYQVLPAGVVSERTYMNIVFKVK